MKKLVLAPNIDRDRPLAERLRLLCALLMIFLHRPGGNVITPGGRILVSWRKNTRQEEKTYEQDLADRH